MSGVGKLTVGKLLAANLPARLIDNHLLIDLAVSMCDRGGDEYFILLEKLTNIVLEQTAKKPDEIFIITNALSSELEEDRIRLDKLRSFASERNITFIQIFLECELEANKKRMVSEDRKLKGKLLDPSKLDRIYENYTIYHPTSEFALKIDTTNLSAESVSNIIKSYVENIRPV
jgi:shikimate kinase